MYGLPVYADDEYRFRQRPWNIMLNGYCIPNIFACGAARRAAGLQGGWGGWPTGNGKKLGQATWLLGNMLGCSLISFHFLLAIHPIRPVQALVHHHRHQ